MDKQKVTVLYKIESYKKKGWFSCEKHIPKYRFEQVNFWNDVIINPFDADKEWILEEMKLLVYKGYVKKYDDAHRIIEAHKKLLVKEFPLYDLTFRFDE